MLKVGLTGGIGSGKSIVCKVFSALGIPVYAADEKAKSIIQTNGELKELLIGTFGSKAYTAKGYNTSFISGIVFHNELLLHTLNSIVHPFVESDFMRWCENNQQLPYVIQEAAILFESGANKLMDYTLFIDAPDAVRIQRVMSRDRLSEPEVRMRMQSQWPTEKIRLLADWIICNDDKKLILPQILKVHNHLLTISKAHG
jgi:dephospho-CoA kinase